MVGDLLELTTQRWAHGGHCVARHDDLVVFVRHALPGERVRARVTEVRRTLARADAVEVLTGSPDRVSPPCRYAGPGGCGGCDFQHVSLPAQRAAKAAIVIEQLTRLAGLPADHRLGDQPLEALEVTAVPAGEQAAAGDGTVDGLGWRTRVQFAVDGQGRAGLRRHRSHDIVPIEECLLADPGVAGLGLLAGRWPAMATIEGIASSAGDRLVVLTQSPAQSPTQRRGRAGAARRPQKQMSDNDIRSQLPDGVGFRVESAAPASRGGGRPGAGAKEPTGAGRGWVREIVRTDDEQVSARVSGSGFWQVHPGAPAALVSAVLGQLQPATGERVLDLYGGVGLFSIALAPFVGVDGSVTLIEGDARAVRDARRNLHVHPQVRCLAGRVERELPALGPVDLVVLDPPRAGAGRQVIEQLITARPRRISYVACDPASLARDTALLRERGYELDQLVAFDLFPMTQHVECVARFSRVTP